MPKTLSSNIVYTCPILRVEEREVEYENGHRETHWVVVRQPYVGIVAFDNDKKLILIKEARGNRDADILDIPGGKVNNFEATGDELLNQAQQELLEETGYRAGQIQMIDKVEERRNWFERDYYYFVAWDLHQEAARPEGGEALITVEIVDPRNVTALKVPSYLPGVVQKAMEYLHL